MIYKNYDDDTLRRVLPAAIALAIARTSAYSPLDPQVLEFGKRVSPRIAIPPQTIGHLIGLEDFASQLPALTEKRRQIQRRRQRSDAELLPLFLNPSHLHEIGGEYHSLARSLIAELEIDRLLDLSIRSRATTIAIPCRPLDLPPIQTSRSPLAPDAVPMVSDRDCDCGRTGAPAVCLESLRVQTYPAERRELIVVDNGSARESDGNDRETLSGSPRYQEQRESRLRGCEQYGLRAAAGSHVAFLNDDTRVDPRWLTELVGVTLRRRAACVASQILTWDGQQIDFTGGTINFEGTGFHADQGRPVGSFTIEKPTLFATGAAMLVDRAVLLDIGGWDEGTFAYYEDVELGWRFWLLGEEVWSAPTAVVFHKIHGTSGRWATASRLRL